MESAEDSVDGISDTPSEDVLRQVSNRVACIIQDINLESLLLIDVQLVIEFVRF